MGGQKSVICNFRYAHKQLRDNTVNIITYPHCRVRKHCCGHCCPFFAHPCLLSGVVSYLKQLGITRILSGRRGEEFLYRDIQRLRMLLTRFTSPQCSSKIPPIVLQHTHLSPIRVRHLCMHALNVKHRHSWRSCVMQSKQFLDLNCAILPREEGTFCFLKLVVPSRKYLVVETHFQICE